LGLDVNCSIGLHIAFDHCAPPGSSRRTEVNVMEMESTLESQQESAFETRLWQAVILSAVEDWISGGQRIKSQAELYLFHDQTDFPLVCESAGINVDRLRSRLKRLRGQQAGSDAGQSRNVSEH
jgi:hypothetical protein